MKTLLPTLGITAALIMCAVSAAMNYLFLSSLGKSALEGQVLGAASAAADVLKALLPFFIAWSWQARRFVAAGAGSLAFAFIAAFSFLSAIGFAADNRLVLLDRHDTGVNAYARLQRELAALESQRSALPRHRSPAIVAENIEGHRQNRRWRATHECNDATEAESREFCTAYFALRAELAAGQEATRLSAEIAALQTEANTLRQSGAGNERDPQVALLSRLFGQPQEPVRLTLIIAVALLVEIGASLGLFLASGHGGSGEAGEQIPLSASSPEVGSIENFCLEALIASPDSVLATEAIFAAYAAWCSRIGKASRDFPSFAAEFAAIAQAVGLRKDRAGYRSIAIAAPEVTFAAA